MDAFYSSMKTDINPQPDKGGPVMRNSFRILLSLLALPLLMAACVPIATEETAAEPAPRKKP